MSEESFFPEWKSFLGKSGEEETALFIKSVVKRSGDVVPYNRAKIESAIGKAICAVEKYPDPERAAKITDSVEEKLRLLLAGRRAHSIPAIEEIQDLVESALIEEKQVEVAKAYILFKKFLMKNFLRNKKYTIPAYFVKPPASEKYGRRYFTGVK